MPRLTFAEAYFGIRNKLRKFNRDSILDAALTTLRGPYKDRLEEMQSAPGQTLLLVKWALQDAALDRSETLPRISRQQFGQIRQMLWQLPDRIESKIGDDRSPYLFIRQLLRPQAGFQTLMDPGFVREAALLGRLPVEHRLRKLWRQKTGIEPSEFMAMQYAAFAMINSGVLSFRPAAFEPIESALPPGTVQSFLRLIARTVPELCAFVRGLPDAREKKQSEMFEFPVLSRFPLLAAGEILHCWHPAVFCRGLEGLVHNVLAEAGQEYIDSFSKVFEHHVTTEACSLRDAFYPEGEIQRWIGRNSEVPDGLLSYPECNIWVESKAGIFDESVMAVGHGEMFRRKTRALQKAASQAWAASKEVRNANAAPQQIANAETDYLLIVTNKELSAGRGTMLASMYPEGTLAPSDPIALERLPLAHMYTLSIPDFERLIDAARAGKLYLPTFLRHCILADSAADTSRLYMHQHLADQKIQYGRSQIVDDALRACEECLTAALQKFDGSSAAGGQL
ncbi:hypothetical protein [Solimonas sp. SE-A11]|uniref:GapS1 family protein n=1 Tax=Solimonas sp. SE-A11 TaxID=3054954 RepID=UPI00259D17AA|nr:hypothetical protein [Solimonas sp. SE-A11]MDM4770916.1 hypothetical protein [Solimonas sp. SE-A11]